MGGAVEAIYDLRRSMGTKKTDKLPWNPIEAHDSYQERVARSLERARDDGFDEMMSIMRSSMPEEVLARWEATYKHPKFIKVDIDRICSRCGATVYSGGREQHKRWHKNMTFTMWSMQAGILQALKTDEGET